MEKITKDSFKLKNIQHSESLSEETNAYTATVYVNGKRAFFAENHGTGGSDNYHPIDKELFAAAEAWAKAQPPHTWTESDGTAHSIPYDLELLVGDLLEEWLKAKDAKRIEATYKRWCKKETVFRLPGDKADHWRRVNIKYGPLADQWIAKKYPGIDVEVLNQRFEKAVTIAKA